MIRIFVNFVLFNLMLLFMERDGKKESCIIYSTLAYGKKLISVTKKYYKIEIVDSLWFFHLIR